MCPKLLAVRVVRRVCSARLLESLLLAECLLPSHHPTSRTSRSPEDLILRHLPLLGAVPFYKGLQFAGAFSVGVLASMMDTGCCALADIKVFSLPVDMSLYLVTHYCAVSTKHPKPCKCSSWRCNADIRAQGILFGEIESIAHEPTVTNVNPTAEGTHNAQSAKAFVDSTDDFPLLHRHAVPLKSPTTTSIC